MDAPFLKRRIWWETRAAKAVMQGGGRTVFRWQFQKENFQVGDGRIQERESWRLFWEGLAADHFDSELDLKLFLIRFVYSIDEEFLIPSELLFDAGLHYLTGDWVDTFFCRDENDEIGRITPENATFPAASRRIRLPELADQRISRPTPALDYFQECARRLLRRKPLPVAKLPQILSGPRFQKIAPDWEDFSGLRRAYPTQTRFQPPKEISDEEATYVFNPPKCAGCSKPEKAVSAEEEP